jgi:hypothetical protein
MITKNPISFSVIKNDSFCLFFQGQLTKCLFVDLTILIVVLALCKIGKNNSYILKIMGFFLPFLKYKYHSYLFRKMYGPKFKNWGILIIILVADVGKKRNKQFLITEKFIDLFLLFLKYMELS